MGIFSDVLRIARSGLVEPATVDWLIAFNHLGTQPNGPDAVEDAWTFANGDLQLWFEGIYTPVSDQISDRLDEINFSDGVALVLGAIIRERPEFHAELVDGDGMVAWVHSGAGLRIRVGSGSQPFGDPADLADVLAPRPA